MYKKIVLIACCLWNLCGLTNILLAQSCGVIPMPQEQEWAQGSFVASAATCICTNLTKEAHEDLKQGLSVSSFLTHVQWQRTSSKKSADIQLHKISRQAFVDSTHIAPDAVCDEAYLLQVTPWYIRIVSTTDTGLFYGLQTLEQLADSVGALTWKIPAVRMVDAPRFAYRGFMMDVSRHFRSKEFIKKQIDAMARYKLNRLHLHLTDAAGWRLEIKHYPKLTQWAAWRPASIWKQWSSAPSYCLQSDSLAYGGYYTQDEMRELIHYAALRHITIVPEIEMPSHSEEVLAAYPSLACEGLQKYSSDLCVGNEETFTFLEQVLKEVMAIFPSQYIHIGGDEAGKQAWKKCAKCQQRMQQEGLKDVDELQSYLIHRIEVFLNKHGRKLLGWDEIMQGGLAPNAAVMSWRGEAGGLKAAQTGHQVVMTPGNYCYLDSYQDAPYSQPEAIGGYLPLSKVYAYNPVPASFTSDQARYIAGVQGNLWAEYIPTDAHYEYMTYPRLLAIAEVGWTQPERKSYTDFHRRALREVDWLNMQGYHPFPLDKEIGERPEAKEVIHHLAYGKKVRYNAPYNDSYQAQGEQTLTDGHCGGWTYSDGAWQGFISDKRLDVTIDLEQKQLLHEVKANFIQVVNPQVYLPANITISVSSDGTHFTELTHQQVEVNLQESICFQSYGWKGITSARYVRYQAAAHPKVGGWIFTDEIIVN